MNPNPNGFVVYGALTPAVGPAIPWPTTRRTLVTTVHLVLWVNLIPKGKGCVLYGALTLAFGPSILWPMTGHALVAPVHLSG